MSDSIHPELEIPDLDPSEQAILEHNLEILYQQYNHVNRDGSFFGGVAKTPCIVNQQGEIIALGKMAISNSKTWPDYAKSALEKYEGKLEQLKFCYIERLQSQDAKSEIAYRVKQDDEPGTVPLNDNAIELLKESVDQFHLLGKKTLFHTSPEFEATVEYNMHYLQQHGGKILNEPIKPHSFVAGYDGKIIEVGPVDKMSSYTRTALKDDLLIKGTVLISNSGSVLFSRGDTLNILNELSFPIKAQAVIEESFKRLSQVKYKD